MKKILSLAVGGAVSLFSMASLAAEPSVKPAQSKPSAAPGVDDYLARAIIPTDHSHDLHVDWQGLGDFENMMPASDLIVRGRVVRNRADVLRSFDAVDSRVHGDLPITITTVVVEELIGSNPKATAVGGQAAAKGKSIEIQELGGVAPDGCIVHPSDKPLLRMGEEVVLFLGAAEVDHGLVAGKGGRYNVVGGTQGRFAVREGKIRPLISEFHPRSAATYTVHQGRPVQDFVTEVKGLVRTKGLKAVSGVTR